MSSLAEISRLVRDTVGFNKPWVHVAGSKGKGTTVYLAAELLKRAGLKVGTFTSPPELILIDGVEVQPDLLKWKARDPELSDFEAWTVAAFSLFQEASVDIAVVECGWGGARDATNIEGAKNLCVLTHVEGEHLGILGDTVAEIAQEKLGICRAGVPLLTVPQRADVQAAVDGLDGVPVKLAPAMECGLHHPESVGLAVEILESLGFTLQPGDLEALAEFQIPGRMEVLPFGIHTLILDGAHTADSIEYVLKTVREWRIHHELPDPFFAIHILKDKPDALLDLFPRPTTLWVPIDDARARTKPEGFDAMKLNELLGRLELQKEPELWVFLGSFKLVGAVKTYLMCS